MEYFGFPILRNFFISGKIIDILKSIGFNMKFDNIDMSYSIESNEPMIDSYFKNINIKLKYFND